ncbi:hypothetical protein U7230_08950 [Carboxydochorda subterranea]|uniref:Uncharacterized protein n=1 Tax=Carboxydichorda subterranea TaxID=3109565 RepID=A0ABZ1BUD0_9FIRM|nr:hypothetical protein [Limnochorda sp. L945t]WRP16230.1 hypothetical protein U7230_08950 [Limnochorda sp. L945t]
MGQTKPFEGNVSAAPGLRVLVVAGVPGAVWGTVGLMMGSVLRNRLVPGRGPGERE